MAVIPRAFPVPSGPVYSVLIGLIAIQFFGNQMAGSFWLVYLVSAPQSLPFQVAVLVWLLAFGMAAIAVLALSTGRPIRARTSMTAGMLAVAAGHVSFVLLPPVLAIPVAGVGFGIYIPLFWLPMNTLLVRTTHRGNRAGRLAGLTATFTTVAVGAPVLGGYIALVAGYPRLFVAGGTVVLANLVLARRVIDPTASFAFSLNLRGVHGGTLLAILGQGGVDGLLSVATPLGSFRFTSDSFQLGLLFALVSLAAGIATVLLGRISDRRNNRLPFLIVGPILSVPACVLAFAIRDLGTFAFALGWLSMTSAIAPSFIYTILVERMEHSVPIATASREFALNLGRALAILAGLMILALGGDVYALFLLVGGIILLEALAR
jgi:predicted MFS family arabinose efflux permease